MRFKFNFSKFIMFAVMCTYFALVLFSMFIIYRLLYISGGAYVASTLTALFGFCSTVVGVAIGFYSNKSKAENTEKIRQNMNGGDNIV